MSLAMNTYTENERRDISNCTILGRLVEDYDDNIPALGLTRTAITYRSDDRIVIYIQPISDEPKLLRRVGKDPKGVYITFDNRSQAFFRSIKYPYEATVESRIEFLKNHLKDRLILFRPRLNYRTESTQTFHFNFDFVWVGDKVESDFYHAVPYVERNLSSQRFEKFLVETQKFAPFSMMNYPNLMEAPEFILCDKQIYYLTDPDALGTNPENRKLYFCKKPDDIYRMDLPDDWNDNTRAAYQDLVFITDQYRIKLKGLFAEHGHPITNESFAVISQATEVGKQNDEEPHLVTMKLTEIEFITRLKHMAQAESLFYEDHDLYNFHTALKTNFITILGGMSGTGKTRLATLYAQALGLKINDDCLIIPVSPSFTEPADILGYLNHQLAIYVESETGLVSFLKKASENPDKIHMVIFDEMNLGQVEHYFSPFISLLEMNEKDRYLTLFSENSVCRDKTVSPRIQITNNLIIVGTANFDETTKDFSKRLLDRANVIQIEKMDLARASTIPHLEESESFFKREPVDAILYRTMWTEISNGIMDLEPEERAFLDELHNLISNTDAQTGVSFRVVTAISNYLKNIPKDENGNPLLTRYRGLDYQIKQRLLTKLRGHREQLENLIGSFDFSRDIYQPGDLGALFEDEQNWKYSREFLIQKAKELTRNGYTL